MFSWTTRSGVSVSTNTGTLSDDDEPLNLRAHASRLPWPCLTAPASRPRASGNDVRYLVVFKDTTLKTIRDLRPKHLPLLDEIKTRVQAWLCERQKSGFCMYFHYVPSVFQLHLHVREKSSCRQHIRIQPLQNVMNNMTKTPTYYKDALIMTKFCKTLQKAETHRKIEINI